MKIIKKIPLTLLLLSFFSNVTSFKCYGQTNSSSLKNGLDLIYNFEFDRANLYLQNIKQTSNSEYTNLYELQLLRWKYIPIHEAQDSISALYRQLLQTSSTYQLKGTFDSIVHVSKSLLLAEYYFNNQQFYKAFNQASNVYGFISPKLTKDFNLLSQNWILPYSLYHYYYDYYKASNGFAAALIWPLQKGIKAKGIYGLKQLAESNSYSQTEALIYLSHIFLRMEDSANSAIVYAEILHQKHPENLKFYELFIESNLATGNNLPYSLSLADKLINSGNTYFIKYGLTYQALLQSKNTPIEQQKLKLLKEALNNLQELGGGKHLESLLYKAIFLLEPSGENKDYYGACLERSRQYQYVLTKIN